MLLPVQMKLRTCRPPSSALENDRGHWKVAVIVEQVLHEVVKEGQFGPDRFGYW